MRNLVFVVSGFLLLVVAWFMVWRSMLAGDVAQVKATIEHHYQAIKAQSPTATLKADEVYATGFPFSFRVAVARPTLTQIWGKESYAVSFDKIELQKVSEDEGRYRVLLPDHFDAMYAQEGQAPEKYRITLNEVPPVLLRAQGDSRACSNMPGATRCEAVAANAPLISFAALLPRRLVLDVALNGQARQIGFDFMSLGVPIFVAIPAQVSHPLQTFVGMLREAMVFSAPQ